MGSPTLLEGFGGVHCGLWLWLGLELWLGSRHGPRSALGTDLGALSERSARPRAFRRSTTIAQGREAKLQVEQRPRPRKRGTNGARLTARADHSKFFLVVPALPGHRILAWSSHPCLVIASLLGHLASFLFVFFFYLFLYILIKNQNI